MFASMPYRQQALFRRDAATMLFQLFVQAPLVLVLVAWVIWWGAALIGLPGSDLATGFLADAFTWLAFVQIYVLVVMMVPAILCCLSDPVGTRLAMWALASSISQSIPHLFYGMAASWEHTTGLPPATAGGVRFAFCPQPAIPASCFSPGSSPQLE